MKFGHLTVIEKVDDKNNKNLWLCECDCAKKTQIIITSYRLTSGNKTHCGCRRTYTKRSEIQLPKEYEDKFKICSKCKKEKELKGFYFTQKLNTKGEKYYYFNPQCIECDKEDATKWILTNPEKYSNTLNKSNKRPERIEYLNELSKTRRKNGEYRKWQQNNPDVVKLYTEKYSNKKHKITEKEWIACKDYFNYECAYCNMTEEEHKKIFNQQLHKEHADDKGSDGLDNCITSCKSCNSSKHTANLEEWYCQQSFFSQEKLNKIHRWLSEDYKEYIKYN